jgi:hypothetical protein
MNDELVLIYPKKFNEEKNNLSFFIGGKLK